MPDNKKLSLGPMPPQQEDYSNYEETRILWGRIGLMFSVVFVVAFAGIYTLFEQNNEGRVVSVLEQRRVSERALASNEQVRSSVAQEARDKPDDTVLIADSSANVAAADELESRAVAEITSTPSAAGIPQANEAIIEMGRAAALDTSLEVLDVSAVSTLHPGIRVATLARDVDAKRRPTDVLGYDVSMNGENLIKVVLHTDMQDIAGVTLFHEWHHGEKRHARVKIPVKSDEQGSFSSKYIDKFMMGEWTVQVRDNAGELYAMANFNVTP